MIKVRKVKKMKPDDFQNTNALNNNDKFEDYTKMLNNVKSAAMHIELPEEFTLPKETKPKNEFTEFLKKEQPVKVNDKKAIEIEKRIVKTLEGNFKVNKKFNDRLDQEIYKYDVKVAQQQQHAKSLFDDIANRTQQYIKLFEGVASNSIFQSMAGLVARTIAPPPTENEVLTIKDRIKKLDPSLITDVYTISQIVQSPELMAYIKSLYDHVKNNVATNKDLQYILNIVKPIIDYIGINSDKFNMTGSPWLMEVYNKIKGTTYISPSFTSGTPQPQPITTAPATFNFQSDSTAPPGERHDEIPQPAETIRAQTIILPEASPPGAPVASPPSAPSFNPDRVSSVIQQFYNLAFSDRASLEYFYNELLKENISQPELRDLSIYMKKYNSERPLDIPKATNSDLITPLLDALNSLSYVYQNVKNQINNKGRRIISDNFFFQQSATLAPTTEATRPPSTYTEADINYLKTAYFTAFRGITFLKDLFFTLVDNRNDRLKKFPSLHQYITYYNDTLGEDIPEDVVPTIQFTIGIFNALNTIDDPSLNEFKQIIRRMCDDAVNDPTFNTAKNLIDMGIPINYTPFNFMPTIQIEPVKATQPIQPSLPQPAMTQEQYNKINTSVSMPMSTPFIMPKPVPMTEEQIKKIKSQKPVRVKISKKEAEKIVETIINNSTNTSDVIGGFNTLKSYFDTFAEVVGAGSLIIGAAGALLALKKYYSSDRKRLDYEIIRDPGDIDYKEKRSIIVVAGEAGLKLTKTTVNDIISLASRAKISTSQLAMGIFDFIKNVASSGTREEAMVAVKKQMDNLNEIVVESGQEINLKQAKLKKKAGESSGLTQEEKDQIDLNSENVKLKKELTTSASKSFMKDLIKGTLINEIIAKINIYTEGLQSFMNSKGKPITIKTFDKYKQFYNVVQLLSSDIRPILINLGFSESEVFGVPFNALAGEGTTKYSSIQDQFTNKDYTTLIKKIQGWLNVIGPKIQDDETIKQLYYLILNIQSIITKNHVA